MFQAPLLALPPSEPQQLGKGRGRGAGDGRRWNDGTLGCSLVTGLPGVLRQRRILQLRRERILQPDHRHVPRLPQVRAGRRALHGNSASSAGRGTHIEHQARKPNALLCGGTMWIGEKMGKERDARAGALTRVSTWWERRTAGVHAGKPRPRSGLLKAVL